MPRALAASLMVAALTFATPARADDCGAGLVCASDPRGIISVLEAGGYKAQWLKSKLTQNPMIASAANGYAFDIHFYGCVNHADCNSVSFTSSFQRDAPSSVVLTNEWNRANRFSQMSYDPETGMLSLAYDLSTKGGLTVVNFTDVLDWWVSSLANLREFFAAHPAVDAIQPPPAIESPAPAKARRRGRGKGS